MLTLCTRNSWCRTGPGCSTRGRPRQGADRGHRGRTGIENNLSWRSQGIGSQLVDRFKAWANTRGVAQLRVSAYTANEAAIRFYRRHGFVPLDTTLALSL